MNNGRPIIEETKRDKRINLMFTEKLKEDLQTGASLKQTSLNSLIIEICQKWVYEHYEELESFKQLSSKLSK